MSAMSILSAVDVRSAVGMLSMMSVGIMTTYTLSTHGYHALVVIIQTF
jgi:hypothetical protein